MGYLYRLKRGASGYFIPNESIDKNNFNGSYGERRLYEEFQKLSDEYIVFHSLNWKKEKVIQF